jgi:diguanylate cyclase (GGDEF)-like protein
MRLRVTTWRHVFVYSGLITALAVAVPLIVVGIAMGRVPMVIKFPILMISGLIPLFITVPISIFALQMLKTVNLTVKTLDELLKYDTLTGLLTRGNFLRLISERRKKSSFLAFVDADHFKKINDNYGHEAGDEALKHMSTLISQVVSQFGFVARMGGEEFAVYLPGVSRSQAVLVCTNLCSSLRNQSFNYRGTDICVTASVGLVEDILTDAISTTLRRADMGLYKAKQNGRDRIEFEDVLDEKASFAA